jgi:hypothetical protein
MCSVPPYTGFPELAADADADGDDGDELHAASPVAVMTTAASPAKRLAVLVIGMSRRSTLP